MMEAVAELISTQEYLELERKSAAKHEYIDGRIVEMTGASKVHNLITTNVVISLGSQLLRRSGEVYSSDMRVKIPATGRYTYPDIVVVENEALLEDRVQDTLLNPTVLMEILSSSTEKYDRGEKFLNYRTIESLQEYIMISQDSYQIEHYVRQPDGRWLLAEAKSLAETMYLPSIDCNLPLADVYNKVEIETDTDTNTLNGHQH